MPHTLIDPESYEEYLARTGLADEDASLDAYIFACMTGG